MPVNIKHSTSSHTETWLEAHLKQYQHIYDMGLLDPKKHYRFVEEMAFISAQSGVPKKAMLTSMVGVCSQEEVDWVVNLYKNIELGVCGLLYEHVSRSQVRMLQTCGALLRNGLDVRLIMVQELITALKEGVAVDNHVIAIPNFHVCKASGGSLPQWQVSMLLGWLQGRAIREQVTLLASGPLSSVVADYGETFSEHFEDYYKIIKQ